MMVTLQTLAERPQWLVWKIVERDGEPTKMPCNGTRTNDPMTWMTLAQAKDAATSYGGAVSGFGLLLGQSGNEWIAGIDLDSCRAADGGEIERWATEIVERFNSYTEVSPSGTGLKVFFRLNPADVPGLRKSLSMVHGRVWKRAENGRAHPPGIEFYISHRFFATTGKGLKGTPAEMRCVAMADVRWLVRTAGPALRGHAHTAHAGRTETSAQPDSGAARPRDMSRSAVAFRLARRCRDEGRTYAEYVQLLQADPATAAWWQEKGRLNDEREAKRAWEHAAARPPASVDEEQKVEIIVRVGRLDELATEAETAIVVSGLSLFQRGKTLVHPYVFKSRAAPIGGCDRETMFTGMQELSEPRLVDYWWCLRIGRNWRSMVSSGVRLTPYAARSMH